MLAVKYTATLDCSNNDKDTAGPIASVAIVLRAVHALHEVYILVNQQIHSNQSLKTLDDGLKRFHKKKGAFGMLKISNSV